MSKIDDDLKEIKNNTRLTSDKAQGEIVGGFFAFGLIIGLLIKIYYGWNWIVVLIPAFIFAIVASIITDHNRTKK